MQILILTAALPYPPHAGGAIRAYGLLHGLHAAGHDLTLLSLTDSEIAEPQDTPLAQFCTHIETVPAPKRSKRDRVRDLFFSAQPDVARRLYSPHLWERLQSLLAQNNYDLIQFEGIEAAGYLPMVRAIQPHAKLCYDAFNLEYDMQRVIYRVDRRNPRRWHAAAYSYVQMRRLRRFERELCATADFVLAVSPEDAAGLRALYPGRSIIVVPNGVFVNQYSNNEATLNLGAKALVFTGKMDYRPNVDAMLWFASSMMPRIQREHPQAELYIVGQKSHTRLEPLRGRRGIHLTGWVPEVQPYLNAAAIYVAPLRMGSGTRLKILEAMASGCAVVATSIAASGLLPQVKAALCIADDESTFASNVGTLLENPAERQRLGSAAREAVHAHYDWDVLIPRLLAGYKDNGLG